MAVIGYTSSPNDCICATGYYGSVVYNSTNGQLSGCNICSSPSLGNFTISICNGPTDTVLGVCTVAPDGYFYVQPCLSGSSNVVGQNSVILKCRQSVANTATQYVLAPCNRGTLSSSGSQLILGGIITSKPIITSSDSNVSISWVSPLIYSGSVKIMSYSLQFSSINDTNSFLNLINFQIVSVLSGPTMQSITTANVLTKELNLTSFYFRVAYISNYGISPYSSISFFQFPISTTTSVPTATAVVPSTNTPVPTIPLEKFFVVDSYLMDTENSVLIKFNHSKTR